MSKNGKLKKAQNVERRRLQMEEAMESLALKQAVEAETVTVLKRERRQPSDLPLTKQPVEAQPVALPRREPKQCAFKPCQRYVDPACTTCPYCGHPLPQ